METEAEAHRDANVAANAKMQLFALYITLLPL